MNDILNKLIKTCEWRNDTMGVPVCSAEIAPLRSRQMKLIIDITEQDFHRVCQGYIDYSNTLDGRCLAAISEGTPIPDNATNGDVIKAMFPNLKITKMNDSVSVMGEYYEFNNFYPFDFWNAPYQKEESEDKCKNCEYYRNPDYTRCHECKAESEE